MANEKLVKTIDALWAMEGGSLLQRYAEAAAFVPGAEAAQDRTIEQMVEDERHHGRQLAALLDVLGSTPGLRRVEACSAELNYHDLRAQIPRLIESKKRLIGAYEAAVSVVADEPEAANLIATIAAGHRAHLGRLHSL